jgi:hypothetical protein
MPSSPCVLFAKTGPMTTSVIPPLVVVAVPLTFGSDAASLSRIISVSLLVVTVDSIFLVATPATGLTGPLTTSVIPLLVVVAVPLTFGSDAASLLRMMSVWFLVVTVDSIFLVASPATGSTPLTLPVATSCSTDLVLLSWKDAVSALLLAARLIVFKTDTASVPGTDVVSVPLVIVAVTSVIASFGAKVMAEMDPASVLGIDAALVALIAGAWPFLSRVNFMVLVNICGRLVFFLVAWNHQLRISTSVEIHQICED